MTYQASAWKNGDIIANENLNKIENGIANITPVYEFDPRYDDKNTVHEGKYVGGYNVDSNKISLTNYSSDDFNTVEISSLYKGIIHVPKNDLQKIGQFMLITDTENVMLYSTFWNYAINKLANQSVDYFVYVTDTEVLINVDRMLDSIKTDFKIWITYPNNIDITMLAKLN